MESRPARSADDELMRAFGDGEESALQELFIRFGADVYGIGLRCFPADGRAEAFVERTFLTMLHRSSQYTSRSMPLDTWVMCQALVVALKMSASQPRGPARASSAGRRKIGPDEPAAA
jgi:DNA-directed RNA polymerase specialized sigma24 family protein